MSLESAAPVRRVKAAVYFYVAAAVFLLCIAAYIRTVKAGGYVFTDKARVAVAMSGNAGNDVYAGKAEAGGIPGWETAVPEGLKAWYRAAFTVAGGSSAGFHAAQIVIFALCATCVYLLGIALGGRDPGAVAAAAGAAIIFAAHPIGAAAATWISAAGDVLGAGLAVCSIALFVKDSASPRQSVSIEYGVAVVLFIAGAFVSPEALLAPLAMAVAVRYDAGAGGQWGRIAKLTVFVAAAVVFVFLYMKSGVMAAPWSGGGMAGVANTMCGAGVQGRALFVPSAAAPVLSGACEMGKWNSDAVIGGALLGAMFALCVVLMAMKRGRWLAVAAAGVFAALLCYSLTVRPAMTGYGALPALAFLSYAVCGVAARAAGASSAVRRIAAVAVLTVAVSVAAAPVSNARLKQFSSAEAFWGALVKINKSDAWVHHQYAFVLEIARKPKAAGAMYMKATELSRYNREYVMDMARFYLRSGDYSEAGHWFKTAVLQNPRDVYAHTALATVFYKQGDYQNSYGELVVALELTPKEEDAKEIEKSIKLVLAEAEMNKVKIITEGVTDEFNRMLKEMDEAMEKAGEK